jgi:hypothetical protein
MGVDLSKEWVPPNVQFMVDDVEDEWPRLHHLFDYINSRHMAMAIKSWPKLLKQAYEYTLAFCAPVLFFETGTHVIEQQSQTRRYGAR